MMSTDRIFEMYKQNEGDNNIIHTSIKRYHTISKEKAFKFIYMMNKKEGKNVWRVAIRIQDMIIFDVDGNTSIENIKNIVKYYTPVFGDMTVWKTNGGYHIHTKKYSDDLDFSYMTMKVLNPLLDTSQMLKYAGYVQKWYQKKLQEEFELKLDKNAFLESIQRDFTMSGLYCGIGEFDILFALNVVLKGYYCIRISKKSEKDKPYKVIL